MRSKFSPFHVLALLGGLGFALLHTHCGVKGFPEPYVERKETAAPTQPPGKNTQEEKK